MARRILIATVVLASGCAALTNLDGLRGDAATSDASQPEAAADAAPIDSAGDSGVVFFDDFNRASSNQIGNG